MENYLFFCMLKTHTVISEISHSYILVIVECCSRGRVRHENRKKLFQNFQSFAGQDIFSPIVLKECFHITNTEIHLLICQAILESVV